MAKIFVAPNNRGKALHLSAYQPVKVILASLPDFVQTGFQLTTVTNENK